MNCFQTFKQIRISLITLAILSLASCWSHNASADVRLPGFFGSHMVLQQKQPIKLWGWADANESITATIGENSATATADGQGKWKLELPAMPASNDAVTLTVKGNNTIELTDVLIGEVWLCSGQSNMEWSVARSATPQKETASANYPLIRHIKVSKTPSSIPLDDIKSKWEVCSPKTAGNFTACGYFMARKLHAELKVPIGLLNSSWGGTRVEPWTPPIGFKNVPALADIHQSVVGRTPGSPEYQAQLAKHIAATEQWLAKAKQAVDTPGPLTASPAFPSAMNPYTKHQDPTMLYNGMIHAMVGFPIRGAIWYQGESNHSEGMLYFEKKKALIQGWRELWGQGDFPFYFVQIAPYRYGNEDPTILAKFWEAQTAVTTIPNTGMVVTNDIATIGNIHPPNKQDVGLRLANLALKNDYGRADVVASGPEFASLEVMGSKLKVQFKNTGGQLKTRDDKAPSHFELIGTGSGGFQPAAATIEGDWVVLTSDGVQTPTAFRYAWNKIAEPNLCGASGLPASAVRGGEMPEFINTLPLGTDYKLVYELDMANLAADINYDVDNSDQINGFDRIGYLVSLKSSEFGDQDVFVTMKAFTDDVKKIGVPTFASKAHFQQALKEVEVFTNTKIVNAGKISKSNIEFWPNNYGPNNGRKIRGAKAEMFDFDDTPSDKINGHGSMQIHNWESKQTLFSVTDWRAGAAAGIGIGNQKTGHPDWTFAKNAGKYSSKKLKVYVRTK